MSCRDLIEGHMTSAQILRTTQYMEYMENTEWELAWKFLKEVADELDLQNPLFWKKMAEAAMIMAEVALFLSETPTG
jgi:hypothetical protein